MCLRLRDCTREHDEDILPSPPPRDEEKSKIANARRSLLAIRETPTFLKHITPHEFVMYLRERSMAAVAVVKKRHPTKDRFFTFSDTRHSPRAPPSLASERSLGLSESSRTSSMRSGADLLRALPVALFPSLLQSLRPPLCPPQSPLLT